VSTQPASVPTKVTPATIIVAAACADCNAALLPEDRFCPRCAHRAQDDETAFKRYGR